MSVRASSEQTIAERTEDGHEVKATAVRALLLAVACGIVAANIYYLQPLASLVTESLGLPTSAAGLLASMTQIGYGIGIVLIVPLADLMENRRLIGSALCVAVAASTTAVLAPLAAVMLPAAFVIGLGSVAVQLIVVYAAYLARPIHQGRGATR